MPLTSVVHYETDNPDLVQGFRVSRTLVDTDTKFQRVRIYETPAFGKVLVLDDETQSAQSDEAIYHESLVHPAMATCGCTPRNILIIGGGEGATAREVLRYSSVENVVMLDIDAELMKLCRTHLPEWGATAWKDPRLHVIATDAFAWLATTAGTATQYDVIIIDLCDPDWTDPENQINRFYTRQFAQQLYDSFLTSGGVLVMQCGDYTTTAQCSAPYVDVFGHAASHVYTTFIPSFMSKWGFLLVSRTPQHISMHDLPHDLQYISISRLQSILACNEL